MKRWMMALFEEWPVTVWHIVLLFAAYIVFAYRRGHLPSLLPMIERPVRRADDPVGYWVRLVGMTIATVMLAIAAWFLTFGR